MKNVTIFVFSIVTSWSYLYILSGIPFASANELNVDSEKTTTESCSQESLENEYSLKDNSEPTIKPHSQELEETDNNSEPTTESGSQESIENEDVSEDDKKSKDIDNNSEVTTELSSQESSSQESSSQESSSQESSSQESSSQESSSQESSSQESSSQESSSQESIENDNSSENEKESANVDNNSEDNAEEPKEKIDDGSEFYESAKQYLWMGYFGQELWDLLEKASMRGHRDASNRFGMLHLRGYVTGSANYELALKYFRISARPLYETVDNQNDLCQEMHSKYEISGSSIYSLMNIAYMHEHGLGVDKNIYKAIWCLSAGNADNDKLLIYLARLYKSLKEYRSAIEVYHKTIAKFESGDAMSAVGQMYENGLGTDINIKKAIELYMRAKNNPEAQLRLAHLHQIGNGVDRNVTQAMEYAQSASQNGNVLALSYLGFLSAIEQKHEDAVSYMERAARQREPYASLNYGIMLREGLGLSPNTHSSFSWIERAADNNLWSMLELSQMHTNQKEAQKWYQKAQDGYDKLSSDMSDISRNEFNKILLAKKDKIVDNPIKS